MGNTVLQQSDLMLLGFLHRLMLYCQLAPKPLSPRWATWRHNMSISRQGSNAADDLCQ